MKVLFLDIDGVVNNHHVLVGPNAMIGIDPYMAFLVGKIVLDTECEVVISSSWRHSHQGLEEIAKHIVDYAGITPTIRWALRGEEIQEWLDNHPQVTSYAILDDEDQVLESQRQSFFKTDYYVGLTPEIAKAVTEHLNAH